MKDGTLWSINPWLVVVDNDEDGIGISRNISDQERV